MSELGTGEWGALGGATALISLLIGYIVRLMDRLNKAQSVADAASKKAAEAVARAIDLEKSLIDLRVVVAKEYVSKETLAALENRIVDAINRLGDRLDSLFKQSGEH